VGGGRAQDAGPGRVRRALAGERVAPPVRGLSFVDPALLPGPGDGGPGVPARALARACADAGLDFAFVPSWEPWAAEAAGLLHEAGVAGAWVVPGVLWPALEAEGVLSTLRLSVAAPPELTAAMDSALEKALADLQAGPRDGAGLVVVADDMAGAAGPLMDPAFLVAEVFPRLAAIVARAHEAGLPAVLHCDGDARRLMQAARGAGFVAIHGDAGGGGLWQSAEAEARRVGLAIIGGIPTASLATANSASASAEHAFALARAGGVLVSDDGGVTLACEAETLVAVLASGVDRDGND
jgi:hypothetical protein